MRQRLIDAAWMIVTTFVLAPAASTCAQDLAARRPADPPSIVSTFIAEPGAKYPFRQNMYEPVLLPDGRILGLSVTRQNRQQTMQGRYSTDEGRTWTPPVDLFNFPHSAGGFALFDRLLDRDGEIHIFILCDANSGLLYPSSEEAAPARPGNILEVWYVKSLDHLKRWSVPRRICEKGDDILSVIQLRNGRIVLPLSFRRMEDYDAPRTGFEGYTYDGRYGVTSMYSDDEGNTWQRSADVLVSQTPDLGTDGLNEPVAIQLKDGRIWMLMRSQCGRFYESYSPDGSHWSQPEPSNLISSDSPAGLIGLKDGGILLFCNACLRYPYAYGGRYVLHGAISEDDGRTWRGFRELFRDPLRGEPIDFSGDYGYSYTFPTLTPQGNVLFSNWVEPDCGKTRTFKLLDPRWLLETHQETDFSSGLDDWSIFGSKGVELQPSPLNQNARVLCVHKANPAWPAAAVWNFPIGSKGTLKIRLLIQPGFEGGRIGLTDHFSVPWENQDKFFNIFNLEIGPDGTMSGGGKLNTNQWYGLQLDWDTTARSCQVFVDGNHMASIQDNRRATGVNYLRVRSIASQPDAGLLLSNVTSDVSASWP